MKRMKKFLAVMLAAIMVMSMGTSVFADDTTYTLKITGVQSSAHTYQAYQIFAGTLSNDGTTLSDITSWGTGVSDSDAYNSYSNIYAELATISVTYEGDTVYPFTSNNTSTGTALSSASAVATALSTYSASNDLGKKFADVVGHYLTSTVSGTSGTAELETNNTTYYYDITGLTAGYYLVKDQAGSLTGTDEAYTDYIVQIVKSTSVAVKEDVPTVTKYVSNGTSTAQSSTSDDAISASIGSELTFTLVGTLPTSDALSAYDTYKYIFHDTLSTGLTLNTGSIKVYATNSISDLSTLSTSAKVIDASDYSKITDSTSLTDGCSLEISFSDILTANISEEPTLVTAYTYIVVQYTATLNTSATIGYDSTSKNSNTVYLQYSNDPNSSSSSASGGDPSSTDTPTGKTTEEVVDVYAYELDITKADGTGSSANKLSGAVFVLYDSNNNYATINSSGKVTGWVTSTTYNDATDKSDYQVTSGSSGEITISGLGEGTYYLKEITAPSGYNLLSAPVSIVISATDTASSVTNLQAVVTVDGANSTVTSTDSKTLAITIVNTKGSSLPTTGGIGTTMFYVVGMILVLGAAVILVTRRRMGNRV